VLPRCVSPDYARYARGVEEEQILREYWAGMSGPIVTVTAPVEGDHPEGPLVALLEFGGLPRALRLLACFYGPWAVKEEIVAEPAWVDACKALRGVAAS